MSLFFNIYQLVATTSCTPNLWVRPWRMALASVWPTGLMVLVLFALPLATYWNTTFHPFGLRDDYSNLREAHEEPGKIVQFTASNSRPLYGVLLQNSFGRIDLVGELAWLRLAGAIGLGGVAAILFGLLRRLGWSLAPAACAAAMVSLMPAAQVVASWAVTWPYPMAGILSISGFALADRFGERGLGWGEPYSSSPSVRWSISLSAYFTSRASLRRYRIGACGR